MKKKISEFIICLLTFLLFFQASEAFASNIPMQRNSIEKARLEKLLSFECFDTPVRKGYDFSGWNTSADGTGENYHSIIPFIEDGSIKNSTVSLYPIWKPQNYTVSYYILGLDHTFTRIDEYCSDPEYNTGTYKETYGRLPKPELEGYTFDGWYRDSFYKYDVNQYTIIDATEDHKLYGKWIPEKSYIIYTNPESGSATTSVSVKYNSVYPELEKLPEVKGKKAYGWFTQPVGGYEIRQGDTVKITKNTTVYAHFYDESFHGNFDYVTFDDKNASLDYDIDFNIFFKNSRELADELEITSLKTAMAAFDASKVGKSKSENIGKLLNDSGFINVYTDYPESETNSIGYAIGMRDLVSSDGEDRATLIVIAVRGAGYGIEWGGNFLVGNNSNPNHEGFDIVSDRILFGDGTENSGLKAYLEKNREALRDDVKFWVMGFSRGAATANLLCAKLIDDELEGIDVKPDNVFGYCFECPKTSTFEGVTDSKYSGIHNIVNASDFVCYLAMNDGIGWKYDRYGKTIVIENEDTDTDYENHRAKMLAAYNNIIKTQSKHTKDYEKTVQKITKEYKNDGQSQGAFCRKVFETMARNVGSPANYVASGLQTNLMNLMGDVLGGGNLMDDFGDILGILNNTDFFENTNMNDFIFNAGTIAYAHYPELCLAWLISKK